jgi:hypothetical protein
MYKQTKLIFGQTEPSFIIRTTDNAFIPFDLANTDYQEYLKWLEAGNTPLPAEEVGLQPTADEISE